MTDGSASARVLVVEDEPLVAIFLSDLVEDLGYRVGETAANAEQAFALAAAEPPVIAIVDVSLQGGRDGVEIGAALSARHGTTLVFVSGHGDVADWPEVRALAPAAVLRKPCLPNQVEDALRQAEDAAAERGRGTRRDAVD